MKKDKVVRLRISEEALNKLKAEAKKLGITVSETIRRKL